MDTTKAEGTVQELVGKGQDVPGGALGETATQISGKARELRGKGAAALRGHDQHRAR
ncbi:MAG: hypothetical protein QOF74_6188 [Caballeronia mineralivorans]|jgi:uncharacterized protein YjbJ (UPF0337 family)|nr:hypothetical protein [Caballeronia mineralivorans]